jgi:hypothetical protein
VLKVVGSITEGPSTVKSDGYIPLAWRCRYESIPLYWSTGDFDTSLLEIGLDPQTGALCMVTIITAAGCSVERSQETGILAAETAPVNGLSVFDRAPWLERAHLPNMTTWEYRDEPWALERLEGAGRVVDERGPFTITVGPDDVSVWLGEPNAIVAWYNTPTLRCGVDGQGALRLLCFRSLPVADQRRLAAQIG